ncbi:hypothetical protein HMPREF0454_03433 [Hafnia alvei ATCC 51873]|uniref:Uncharacterized protein n=1 Tax=Hafnia alvei ATCC 51873 TaxID=1002364 RepID=G9YA14_HAFAL|nr:hypothetical protein HMPREF0454_03433 [Hafnia alvei ATCC 51873]
MDTLSNPSAGIIRIRFDGFFSAKTCCAGVDLVAGSAQNPHILRVCSGSSALAAAS